MQFQHAHPRLSTEYRHATVLPKACRLPLRLQQVSHEALHCAFFHKPPFHESLNPRCVRTYALQCIRGRDLDPQLILQTTSTPQPRLQAPVASGENIQIKPRRVREFVRDFVCVLAVYKRFLCTCSTAVSTRVSPRFLPGAVCLKRSAFMDELVPNRGLSSVFVPGTLHLPMEFNESAVSGCLECPVLTKIPSKTWLIHMKLTFKKGLTHNPPKN